MAWRPLVLVASSIVMLSRMFLCIPAIQRGIRGGQNYGIQVLVSGSHLGIQACKMRVKNLCRSFGRGNHNGVDASSPRLRTHAYPTEYWILKSGLCTMRSGNIPLRRWCVIMSIDGSKGFARRSIAISRFA